MVGGKTILAKPGTTLFAPRGIAQTCRRRLENFATNPSDPARPLIALR
jgi:hypothetical protein